MESLIMLKGRAAKTIDTEWRYSWYWGKEPEKRHWTMDAKHDCIERIAEIEAKLIELKALKRELEIACLAYIPETEETK